ncbi:hypothetical protein Focb16_v002162 [Fusarium oxysporum f. sp. cubense]|uniref:Uncharacterized protein n=1 Tax=Fusarium oxysporum f. sp. cubense TaxID=61366 RepID=A0A559L4W2_FUSOC|nr:hypothetical protein Focb16_v002162 [Fusarium oxysporum f. sp. cubense]
MLQSSITNCTVTMLQRSLQPPNETFRTDMPDLISYFGAALGDHERKDELHAMAMEIGKTWKVEDPTYCTKVVPHCLIFVRANPDNPILFGVDCREERRKLPPIGHFSLEAPFDVKAAS